MRTLLRGKLSYVFVALLAAAITGGVSWADSGGGSIQACVNDTNGETRIVAAAPADCRQHESATTWSITGPQGIQGPPGPVGPQGPQGERGPSDAYDGFRGNNGAAPIAITSTSSAAPTHVLDFDIPAGLYAVTSKVNLSAGASQGGLVHCITQTTTGWFDMGVGSIGPGPGETLEATLSTTFTADQRPAGKVMIDCWRINPDGPAPQAGIAEAVAIKVATQTFFQK